MISEKRRFILTWVVITISFFITFTLFQIRFTRHRVCPKFGDVLFLEEGKEIGCYPQYKRGPCPKDMILLPLLNNRSMGVCHCDNINNERTLVFHNLTGKCYHVFTRGFCKPGFWVNLATNSGAVCTPNTCLNTIHSQGQEDGQEGVELVPLSNGTCAALHASCDNFTNEVIRFFKRKLYPACHYTPEFHVFNQRSIFAGVSVPSSDCPEGFFKTELGHCAVEFDDS